MPSWKKVILSGSDAALNTLSVSNSITASVISASQFTGSLFGTASWANNVNTASLASRNLLTASVSSNTITFTKGDGSTFPIIVDTGSGGTSFTGLEYQVAYFASTNGTPEGADYITAYPIQSEGVALRVGRNEPTETSSSGSHILKDNRELFTNAKLAVDGEPFVLLGFGGKGNVDLTATDNYEHPGINSYSDFTPGKVYNGSLKLRNTLYGIQDADGNTKLVADGGFVVKPSSPGFLVGQGGYYIFESASMQFNASGALISPVTSASVRLGLATDSSSFTIAVGKNNLQDILFISRSEADARIAVGGNYRTPRNTLDISGSLRVFTSITASTVSASGVISSSNLSITGFPNVSASLASLSTGVGTLQQVTDAGNTTTNPISSSFAGVGFFGTASWAINVVNGGGGGGGGGADSAFLTQSTAAVTWSFAHNLGTQYPVITVYDTTGLVIIPQEIDGEDTNNLKIYFPTSQSGYATAVGGTSALTYYSQSLTTASVNLNTITFTKGDGSTFPITVNTGSGGGGGSDFPYTGSAIISGSLTVTGSVISTDGFTGSLFGTSSWATNALTASFLPVGTYNITASWAQSASNAINARTASFLPVGTYSITASWAINALTASFLPVATYNITSSWAQSASNAINSQTASFLPIGTYNITASWAQSASNAVNARTASFINDLNQNLSITGAVVLSGSSLPELKVIGETQFTGSVSSLNGFTGSLFGTASWATNALTASYVLNAISSSFASTASYVLNAVSSSFSSTASFTPNAITTASVSLNTITFTKGSGATFNITVDTGSGGGGGSVTINNNVDNYLITATGTANTLNGEVGLQYSGSILINASRSQFGGAAVVDTTHQFRGLSSDTYAGFLIQDPDGEDIFKTEGSIANSTLGVFIGDFNNVSNGTGISIDVANDDILLRGKLVADNTKGITGSLFGTASLASRNILTASVSSNTITFTKGDNTTFNLTINTGSGGGGSVGTLAQVTALGASTTVPITASIISASSFTGSLLGTSSWANNALTSSFVNNLNQNLSITGAVVLSGSALPELRIIGETQFTGSVGSTGGFTGSLLGTSSWATNALTASFLPVGTYNITSSWAQSASNAVNARTASFVNNLNQNLAISGAVILSGSALPELRVIGDSQFTGSIILSGSVSTIGTTSMTGSLVVSTNITASRTFLSGSVGTVSGSTLTVYGSGSAQPVFTVQGSSGELFSVTDSLTGSLFSVNDISGLPILEVFSDNSVLIGSYLDPMLVSTAKVTQTNSGSFTVYSLPTASYDTAFFEYSVRSGSNARVGTIMAIQSASSVNFMETTASQFGSTSAISFTVIITGSNMALTGSSTTGSWTIKTIVRGI